MSGASTYGGDGVPESPRAWTPAPPTSVVRRTIWLNWHERTWFQFERFESPASLREALHHRGPWPLRMAMAELDRLDSEGVVGHIVGSRGEADYYGRCDVHLTREGALGSLANAIPFIDRYDSDPLCGREAADLTGGPLTVCMDLSIVSALEVDRDPRGFSEGAIADAIDGAHLLRAHDDFYTSPVLLLHGDGLVERGGVDIFFN